MNKHTPTPYVVSQSHGRSVVMLADYPRVIADCGRQDDARANAELIAKACNCHDELVKACRDTLRKLTSGLWSTEGEYRKEIFKLDAALAKAEE